MEDHRRAVVEIRMGSVQRYQHAAFRRGPGRILFQPDVRQLWRLYQYPERPARDAVLTALRVLRNWGLISAAELFVVNEPQPKHPALPGCNAREATPGASRSCGSACARVQRSARWRSGWRLDPTGPDTSSPRLAGVVRQRIAERQFVLCACCQILEEPES